MAHDKGPTSGEGNGAQRWGKKTLDAGEEKRERRPVTRSFAGCRGYQEQCGADEGDELAVVVVAVAAGRAAAAVGDGPVQPCLPAEQPAPPC